MTGKKIRELLAGRRQFSINNIRERWIFHKKAQAAGFHTQTVAKQYAVRKIRRCNSCGSISKDYYAVDSPQRRPAEEDNWEQRFYKTLEYATVEASREPLSGCRCAVCLHNVFRVLPQPIAEALVWLIIS